MYKLCGGTFFVLLLNSKKEGVETDILCNMLKILRPNMFFSKTVIKEQTKKFKLCKDHSNLATEFENSEVQEMLTEDIEFRYDELLGRTNTFIDNYIDTTSITHKAEILVKAVLEVINQDDSIPVDQEFYILPNGKSVTKKRLASINKVYLPSFVLGILYYVMMNIKDNKEGVKTYDRWCPQLASGTKRKYIANIGENSNRKIVLIKKPDEYAHYELMELSGEKIRLYVKPLPSDSDCDITTTTIMATDTIEEFAKEDYIELFVSPQEDKKIKELIDDCNELICCVNKYHGSTNKADIATLSQTKKHFFYKWLSFPHKFKDDSVQKWSDYILSKIEHNKAIDINNITINPVKLNISELPVYHLDDHFKRPKYHFPNGAEVKTSSDQQIKNIMSVIQKKKNK